MTDKSKRRVWDISQVLRPGIPVWPGDTPFVTKKTWLIEDGSPVNVSALNLSTHTGTHADAPLHYNETGKDAASVELDPYVGECIVIDARKAGALITPEDLPALEGATRVLFRCYARFPHGDWQSDFTAISPDTIEHLANEGVRLVGIDSPSIDPQDSKSMSAHQVVLKHDMRILEGLVLDDIGEGRYELIALPLAIENADASPLRAILRELG